MSSVSRSARLLARRILRLYWPAAVIVAAAAGGLAYLMAADFSGAARVWAPVVTVTVAVGLAGVGLAVGVSRAAGGFTSELWNSAELDARAYDGLDGIAAMRPGGPWLTELNKPSPAAAAYHAISSDYAPAEGAPLARVARDRVTDLIFRTPETT